MAAVLPILALAALVWGVLFARWASLALTALAILVVGYVLGHSFWHIQAGPIPVTLDRLMLFGLAAVFGWRIFRGEVRSTPLAGVDWAILVTLVIMSLSLLANRPDGSVHLPTSPTWRLIVAFWTPAFLYLVTRQADVDARTARWFLIGLTSLGAYLAFTGSAETLQLWSVVFPKFIADPEQGLHYGRARGPALNSVSLGVYLTICFWAAWMLRLRVSRPMRPLVWAAMAAMAAVVYFTYTRSTWIGLAASGLVIFGLELPRQWRAPAFTLLMVVGVAMSGVLWKKIVGLEREDSGSVSAHSVQQREAFAYVSWQMLKDSPAMGVGFGRFYDKKMPYLTDRTQPFELESLRPLHHHNTLLSILVETGILGLGAYLGVLAGFARAGWRLMKSYGSAPEVRQLGMLLLATVIAYLSSALFHDLTLVHSDQWLLFVVAGVAVGCERRVAADAVAHRASDVVVAEHSGISASPAQAM